jgi:hypothetical protein
MAGLVDFHNGMPFDTEGFGLDPNAPGMPMPQNAAPGLVGLPPRPPPMLAQNMSVEPMASTMQQPPAPDPMAGGYSVDPNANFMRSDGRQVSDPGQVASAAPSPQIADRPAQTVKATVPVAPAYKPKPVGGVEDYRGASTGQLQGEIGKAVKQKTQSAAYLAGQADKLQAERQDQANAIGMQAAATDWKLKENAHEWDQIQQKAAAEAKARTAKIDAEEAKLGGMKIDPNRALPKGLAGNLLGAIGAAIGGAAQALTGRNSFMETVNTAIDRDIEAQRAEIDNQKTVVANMKSGLAQRMGIYGDEMQAKTGQRVAYLQSVDRWLGSMQAKAESEGAAMKFAEMRTALQDGIADTKARYAQGIIGERVSAAAAQRAAQDKQLERFIKLSELGIKGTEADAKMLAAQGDKNKYAVPFIGGQATSQHMADKVNERLALTLPLVKTLRSLADVREDLGAGGKAWDEMTPGTSEKVRRMDALAEDAITQLNIAKGQGAISGGDYDRALRMIGSVREKSGSPHKVIRQVANDQWQQSKDYAEGFGVQFDKSIEPSGMKRSVNFTPGGQ